MCGVLLLSNPMARILLGLLLMATPLTAIQNLTRSVCTSPYLPAGWLHLACPGGGLIYVLQAVYGKSSSQRCAFTEGDTCVRNSLYSAPVVACLSRTQCSIPASPVHLSSCGEESDYLQVDYQCIAGDASSRFDVCGDLTGTGTRTGVPLVKEGHIMTPNFPAPYPRHAACYCLITAAIAARTRIQLQVLDFRLEASPGCEYDFVEVQRGGGGPGGVGAADRMCGGIGRWARRTVNSTWARLSLHTDGDGEFRGFWIRVWALTLDDTLVPVTVTCQGQLVPGTSTPVALPGGKDDNYAGPTAASGGVGTTRDVRRIWSGRLPPEGSTARGAAGRNPAQPSSRNTGIIIGVCVAGLVTMVIINIVGIIICRRNMQANRSKRASAEVPQNAPDPGADSSLSSLDTEYISLNAHGATYRGVDLYSTPPEAAALPDDGITIERTPGVGQSSVKPSNYDYGMLPTTYTRKAHTMSGVEPEDGEDPYAVLRDHARDCNMLYASTKYSSQRTPVPMSSQPDYEDIDEYPAATPPLPPTGPLRASMRSMGMEIGEHGTSGRASIHSRLSVVTHHSDLDPDRGHGGPRSPGSGSSGRASCQSVEEAAPVDSILHAPYPVCGYGTCDEAPMSASLPRHQGSACVDCQDRHAKVPDITAEGVYSMHDPSDVTEYAHSEASTTRSEYL